MNQRLGVRYALAPHDEKRWQQDAASMQEAGLGRVLLGASLWGILQPSATTLAPELLVEGVRFFSSQDFLCSVELPILQAPRWLLRACSSHDASATPACPESATTGENLFIPDKICSCHPTWRKAVEAFTIALQDAFRDQPVAHWCIPALPAPCGACVFCASEWKAYAQSAHGELEHLNQTLGLVDPCQKWDDACLLPDTPLVAIAKARWKKAACIKMGRHIASLLPSSMDDKGEQQTILHMTPVFPEQTSSVATANTSAGSAFLSAHESAVDVSTYAPCRNEALWQSLLPFDRLGARGENPPAQCHAWTATSLDADPMMSAPLRIRLHTLAAFLHGVPAVTYDQWQQPNAGADQFSAGLVDAKGLRRDAWEAVRQVAQDAGRFEMVFKDYHPEVDVLLIDDPMAVDVRCAFPEFSTWDQPRHLAELRAALMGMGLFSRVVPSFPSDTSGIRLIVLCNTLCDHPEWAEHAQKFVEQGGTLLVTGGCFVTDEHGRNTSATWPMSLSELLGVQVRQWQGVGHGEGMKLRPTRPPQDDEERIRLSTPFWSEQIFCRGAREVWNYAGYPLDGYPAFTHNTLKRGHAFYASVFGTEAIWRVWLGQHICPAAGVYAKAALPDGVEMIRFQSATGAGMALINHNPHRVDLSVTGKWRDALSGRKVRELRHLRPWDIALLLTLS